MTASEKSNDIDSKINAIDPKINAIDPKIIVALDFDNANDALHLVKTLDAKLCKLKVGKELFTSAGPAFVEKLVEAKFDVFLDLKFHDIPNTVAKACKAASQLGVWMLNVHASGGMAMMEAARAAVDADSHQPLLIAVTVLTSMNVQTLKQVGVATNLEDHVLNLAKLAQQAKLDGVVCSANEAQLLRNALGAQFCLVTPGIRPLNSVVDDQSRIVTPSMALANGAHYLVIGRPITQASSPRKALESIILECFSS